MGQHSLRQERAIITSIRKSVRPALRLAKRGAILALYFGRARHCPVCEKSSRRFRSHGIVRRKDAKCVRCGALERHRFVWLFMSSRTNLFETPHKRMLHVAPEVCLEHRLRSWLGADYLTADLLHPRAMVKMDITNIECPDESFDVIYCSHVFEHVQEDRKAMGEFFRVLMNGGWAILLVPITADATIEDPSVVDPEERLKYFGQSDHVRRYGPDYIDRLREAGFDVQVFKVADLVGPDQAIKMGLTAAAGEIFYCAKGAAGGPVAS